MRAAPSPAALAGAARDRATVQLADGRTGVLVYFPLPLEERRRGDGHGKRRTAAQAKLLLGGRHVLVDPATVEEVLEHGHG